MPVPFRIPVDGAAIEGELHARDGVPLVLVHGFGGTRRDWDALIPDLAGDRPLLTYDQRGFGQSTTASGQAFSHADDLLAVLDGLEIERADLCGMSLGGATVTGFALDHPERVRRLVLASPLLAGWRWSADWIERWKAIGRAARAGDLALARALWWHHPLFDSVRETPGGAVQHSAIAQYHGDQWIRDDQRASGPDADRLAGLRMPMLLLVGERDLPDFRGIAYTITTRAPDVTRIDYAGIGHMLNLEAPHAIARDILRFLAR
ncbi:alpha/beta fold hydrolase [Novosphingobium sp. Leaf2]|uniref:alpha/beta fold hydrolase n=1 Tax=Novosphingobium sp. Leaf2 TaxID=1735670 RepID=UPI000701CBC1|nr:alpha/beta fold hydrolase [Novosphingobium sp. Leaf2]KQM13783.1 3-oxoadipate enol-lactone hydrolase [Novosphingobium sp. Leaf2]